MREKNIKSLTRFAAEGSAPLKMSDMTGQVSWKKITPGGIVTDAGNSDEFETGGWRSQKPVMNWDKCKQCLMCFPVCPDCAIPVNQEGLREDYDYKHCKGCGVCAKVCPFGAIEMKDEA
jgi:pyruvate ferredoxin oxidoreductase delta subunit